MDMHKNAWACLGMHGHAWACIGMHGRAWACMGMLGLAWTCMSMHGLAWARLLRHAWACMGMHGHARACIGMHRCARACMTDSAKIVNAFHAAIIALQMRWWGERVPSKANIADIMTRPERFHELLAGLERGANVQNYDFVMPPIDWDTDSLVEWMRRMRERSA